MKKYIKPESCVYDLLTEGMIANSGDGSGSFEIGGENSYNPDKPDRSAEYQGPYDSSQWED